MPSKPDFSFISNIIGTSMRQISNDTIKYEPIKQKLWTKCPIIDMRSKLIQRAVTLSKQADAVTSVFRLRLVQSRKNLIVRKK